MKLRTQHFALFFLWYLLGACAAVAPVPPAIVEYVPVLPEFADSFGTQPEIPTPDVIEQLSPPQAQHFLAYFNLPETQAVKPYMRVSNYLFKNTLTLAYDHRTYTASQTLELNQGNCLSLAILTTALARLANVEIHYQLVDSSPVFGLAGDLVNRELHVKSVLNDYREVTLDNLGNIFHDRVVIDYFVTERSRFISNISTSDFTAMYYLNMASEALETGDNAKAFWLTREALMLNPANASALNTMAVIHRRAGELAKAEEIYLFALDHAKDKLTLLKNYRVLLTSQGRDAEAETIERRLDSMDDPSPFHWFELARQSYGMQDYNAAVRYFSRALQIAPYLHEAYLGKAQSLYQMGLRGDARHALQMAIQNADRNSTRSLYEAKLMALAGNQ